MSVARPRNPLRSGALGAVFLLGTLLVAPAATAASVSIDHVEADQTTLQVVVSVGDLLDSAGAPDLSTATVTFDGDPVDATAEPASDAADTVRRTAILAMDVSKSMQGDKFDEAKAAATVFLDTVPDDVNVGLVTFASDVTLAQSPTTDHTAVQSAIDGLQLSQDTRLYDGVAAAAKASGTEGSRSILLLSDGRDTSKAKIATATKPLTKSGAKLDVVSLGQGAGDTALLQKIADAGNGQVLSADDPAALSDVFAGEAQVLAQQVIVTVAAPAALAGQEGTLAVTLQLDGAPQTASAFVAIPAAGGPDLGVGGVPAALQRVETGLIITPGLMYAGLGAAALAVMVIILVGAGGLAKNEKRDAVDRNIEAYTRKGAKKLAEANRTSESQSMTQQAVSVAANVLESQKGLEAALGSRLEAAGLALKPAEWLLLHFGVAVGLGLAGLLLGGGSILFLLLGLVVGFIAPWVFLSFKRKKRLAAFGSQLADTLQLMAGSLSAGLSLAQSLDTVVREGSDPIAGEFRRALVEARLGVEIETAMAGIADRMGSVDFEWVVMAIRIQREVGGNLAELLNKVADTIREREYLERQVLTLSAEGRLSVWILGGLPPVFMGYLLLVNPSYVSPMFTNPLGWAMLILMGVLLSVGIFWMKKVTKVEV